MKAVEHGTYGGWLIGFLDVTKASTAKGFLMEPPVGDPIEALWTPGVRYLIRQVPELDGAWTRCLPDDTPPILLLQVPPGELRELTTPRPEAVLITSPVRFPDDAPEPAVPAWAPGTDGVGPNLRDAGGQAVRWILLDGYAYDIRDDLYGQPGRWSVNEWRPQTYGEMFGNPLDQL
jgi:hypothetical protein